MKYKVKISGNFTFYSMSGVDPTVFDSSIDYKPPSKADLHSQINKQGTKKIHLIYKSWVMC